MYRPFTELNLGFSNAENYRRRENKELLERYFVRDMVMDRILNPNVFYLVGEKGTGKTAYATYLTNNDHKDHRVASFDVRQTEYQKFLELKRLGYLPLSQYSEVWRVLLLMTCATSILETSGTPEFLRRFTRLAGLKKAIDEFYDNAFAPEIVKMLSFVEESAYSTSLLAKYGGLSTNLTGNAREQATDSKSVFQINLLKIRQAFETGLSSLKLEKNFLIFIDGVDVRPGDIAYTDYFDCVRGLIEAIWSINNDFLANIKDSKGRMRVVLLVRPDTFQRTGLHNLNTKLRDNSVFLDWNTTYKDYRGSLLFRVADRLLSSQQTSAGDSNGSAWDYYFPFYAENVSANTISGGDRTNSFIAFLRFSYHRPRDITSMITTMQGIIRKRRGAADYVSVDDFNDPSFRDAHAEYLLGEIRDQLLFYYSQDEFEVFLQFFAYLGGKRRFSYEDFVSAFNDFVEQCARAGTTIPQFFESAPVFLQFLYEQNVVCYREKDATQKAKSEEFIRWCFRERSLSNMAPKIRVGVDYEIFYGLSKALNVGRHIRLRKTEGRRVFGVIKNVNFEKGFGFIRGGHQQTDFYFKLDEFLETDKALLVKGQEVSFEVQVRHGQARGRSVRVVPLKSRSGPT